MGNLLKSTKRAIKQQVSTQDGPDGHGDSVVSIDQVLIETRRPLPPVPTLPKSDDENTVRALYDFESARDDDLPFRKGDIMRVDPNSQCDLWWLAKHMRTGKKGYIPSNYVCKNDNSVESKDYWLDAEKAEARKESEIVLMLAGNRVGTFLLRRCSDKAVYLVLSVRYDSPQTGDPTVAHYKIRKMDDGGVYISPRRSFTDVFKLIENYSQNADGLSTRLTEACPRIQPPEGFHQLEIERDVITLSVKLGEGNFGHVWKAKLSKRVDVAVKTLKPGKMKPEDFLEEARTMHTLNHKRLVRLLAVCSREEPIYIVTEYMARGSLLEFLQTDNKNLLKFTVIIVMAVQIADGMTYLEKKNYIHRDLRAANILVGQHYDVKVADFGLAKFLGTEECDADQTAKFPIKWTAPEALLKQEFSVKSDVWSFGVLLYELITRGAIPYAGMPNREVMREIPRGYRMPQPSSCPDAYYEKMQECWQYEPSHRPTFEHLYTFFDDFAVSSQHQYGQPQ